MTPSHDPTINLIRTTLDIPENEPIVGVIYHRLQEKDARILELETKAETLTSELEAMTQQRDSYRECCASLDTNANEDLLPGYVVVSRDDWQQAFSDIPR